MTVRPPRTLATVSGLPDDRQHDFVVNGLMHELRKRRIIKDDCRGATLRANLGLELPDRRGADRS